MSVKIDFRQFAYENALKESEEDVDVVLCPETNKELFFTAGSDRLYEIDSFGRCEDCGFYFHASVLYPLVTPAEWPVHYLGRYCKKCFMTVDEESKLTDEEIEAIQLPEDEEEG